MSHNHDHQSIWDKVSIICFLNLICFGSFYLSSVFITELAPPAEVVAGEPAPFLATTLAFFLGFLARPIGALWFGIGGDLTSPKKAIRESVGLMVLSTALMGILPNSPASHDVFFVALRCLQGIGLGGCYAAMAVYLFEAAPADKKARVTSFIQASVPMGYIVALLGVLLLKMIFAAQFYVDGGWRLAFFTPLVALFFLMPLKDSQKYSVSATDYWGGFRTAILTLKREWPRWGSYLVLTIGIGILAFTAGNFKFYFMKVILRMDPVVVDFSSGLATLLYLPFYYWGARLMDKYDKFKISFWCVLIGSIVLIPSFWILEQATTQLFGQIFKIVLGIGLISSVIVISFGSLIAFLCELFPPKMRCTLFALTYTLTVGVMGALPHAYGIQSYAQTKSKYAGLFLAAFMAAGSAVLAYLLHMKKGPKSSGL